MKYRDIEFDYTDLKKRIRRYYSTQEEFSEVMGWRTHVSLNQRLNNLIDWRTSEIVKACELLEIELAEAHLYFFKQKV